MKPQMSSVWDFGHNSLLQFGEGAEGWRDGYGGQQNNLLFFCILLGIIEKKFAQIFSSIIIWRVCVLLSFCVGLISILLMGGKRTPMTLVQETRKNVIICKNQNPKKNINLFPLFRWFYNASIIRHYQRGRRRTERGNGNICAR